MDKLRRDIQAQTGQATLQLTAFELEIKRSREDYMQTTKKVLEHLSKKPAP